MYISTKTMTVETEDGRTTPTIRPSSFYRDTSTMLYKNEFSPAYRGTSPYRNGTTEVHRESVTQVFKDPLNQTYTDSSDRTYTAKNCNYNRNIQSAGVDCVTRDNNEIPWKERKNRIENALSWLRTELVNMRAQDKVLLGQLQRCQETIDSLKLQRAAWDEESEDGDLDEMEEEDHWEDWEISEFEKGFAECSEFCVERKETVKEKKSVIFQYSESSKVSRTGSFFRQDVEVTV